jgi:pyruvate dehydrogenase E2 component (dihydrolipoamide acetyltransferase)
MVMFGNVDMSVAVAIEGGLITPIVRNADQKSLVQISSEVKQLAAQAREGKLKPEQYEGGSFSISNLGMYGIEEFAAIINPPQAAILAVGKADENDRLALTLSVDHRVIDGALGAELLGAIKGYLEKPSLMLV